MSINRNKYIIQVVLSIILATGLSGCISEKINDAFMIREEIKPKGILVGQDGTIGVRMTSTLYQESFFDSDKHVPIKDQKPRTCFLILPPSYVDKLVAQYIEYAKNNKETTISTLNQTQNLKIVLPNIEFDADNENQEISIIPRTFMAPDASIDQLPPALHSPNMKEYEVTETFPYTAAKETVNLRFDESNLRSFRSKDTWPQIAAIPVFIVEAPIEVVGGFALEVVTLPIVIGGWSLIGITHAVAIT